MMEHDFQDRVSRELANRIAAGLPQHPDWLETARANLDRWTRLNRDAPGLLRCYDEWREVLDRSVHDICAVLTADTEEGQRLRQNSPFAGVLSPAEVWEIKRRCHDATRRLKPPRDQGEEETILG